MVKPVFDKEKVKAAAKETCKASEFELLSCYKETSMFAALRCQEQHSAFWTCFETEIDKFKQAIKAHEDLVIRAQAIKAHEDRDKLAAPGSC